jgi:cytoskeletal protein CcmA (bactofilin family)
MTSITSGIVVTGTVHAEESVSIGGTVKGEVLATHHEVTLEQGGRIEGTATARTITIRGTFVGRMIALQTVRLQRTAWVRAEITAPSIAMEEGATFNGSVETARVEAALRVAAYRRKA